MVTLEAENVELQDLKRSLEGTKKSQSERIQQLELECRKLRDSTVFIQQEKEAAILQAREALQSKQAELMLARKAAEDAQRQIETFASDNKRLNGIAEKLQAERSQLQRKAAGYEASVKAFDAELRQRASAEGKSLNACKDLEQRLKGLQLQNTRLADLAGVHHLEMAQLTSTREELRSWRQRSLDLEAELQEARKSGAWLRQRLAALDASCGQLRAQAEHWRHAEHAAAAKGPRRAEGVAVLSSVNRPALPRLEEAVQREVRVVELIFAACCCFPSLSFAWPERCGPELARAHH